MAASSVLAFWMVALVLIVVPGPDWAFTLSTGLRGRSVLPAVGGLVLGYGAITIVVAVGVGAVVAGSPAILTGLSVIGGAYLTWQGAMTIAKPPASSPVADEPAGTDWNTFLKGVGVSGLNPKGLLIFLALLPQFTNPDSGWPIAAQIGVLGLIFTISCGIFYASLGSATRFVLRARPAAVRALGRLSGALMIAIGVLLIAERLFS